MAVKFLNHRKTLIITPPRPFWALTGLHVMPSNNGYFVTDHDGCWERSKICDATHKATELWCTSNSRVSKINWYKKGMWSCDNIFVITTFILETRSKAESVNLSGHGQPSTGFPSTPCFNRLSLPPGILHNNHYGLGQNIIQVRVPPRDHVWWRKNANFGR